MKRTAYIAFGANEGDPTTTYRTAIELVVKVLGACKAASGLYETRALTLVGAPPQPNYRNGVFSCSTERLPHEILSELLEVEHALGRQRMSGERWAPRTIDLDLLLVDELVIESSSLTLPHPALHMRDFVLVPLRDIAPDIIHPILGATMRELEASLDMRGLERYVMYDNVARGRHP